MCLATPRRVLRVEGERAEIEWDGAPLWVAAGGVPDLASGAYVLVHAGQVLERLSVEEAEQILALHAALESADLNLLLAESTGEVPG